jgi:hypothetical protein
MALRNIPHPEEPAQRASRRAQGADPACLCALRDLHGRRTPDDCAQSHFWVTVRDKPGHDDLRFSLASFPVGR